MTMGTIVILSEAKDLFVYGVPAEIPRCARDDRNA